MKKIKTVKIVSVLLALSLSLALLTFSGCTSPTPAPQWQQEALQAFRDAKFAPLLEDVVPGVLLESNQAVMASFDVTPHTLPTNYVMVADAVKAVDRGFVTLEGEINIVRNNISFANSTRDSIIDNIERLTAYGQWINGNRLDILYCGTIEHRFKNIFTGELRHLVILSADRSKVEIINFPILTDSGNTAHLYTRYTSFDGEVFVNMESYEFFKQGSREYIASRHFGYSEHRNNDGNITATLVQIGETLVDGLHGNALGINTMDITVFGGNEEMIYRHWRRVNRDSYDVQSFFVENNQAWVNVGQHAETYTVSSSMNMLNVARVFYEEEVTQSGDWGGVLSNAHRVIGVELTDGTFLERSLNHYPWVGYVMHYPTYNVFTSSFTGAVPRDIGIIAGMSALGFTLQEEVLCINSIVNGDAQRMLDDVRISRIENISDTEIVIENAEKLFEEMYNFWHEKLN